MSWQKYDLVFRLLAPMHIGWRKTSNLQQTRGYVTGKIFWGALTARLTREAGQGADGQAYQDIGKQVQENFRFTYLYPAIPKEKLVEKAEDVCCRYPWEDDFDYLFLDSYTSAALNYDNQSAEDGLLHETEFIAPHTRDRQPVYLCGAIYAQTALPQELQNWQQALNKLQFGGERGYGWGRVQLVNPLPLAGNEGEPQGELVEETRGGKKVYRITAHLITDNTPNATGPIEPLIGWERNNPDGKNEQDDQKKWKLSNKATICYAPGAVIAPKASFTIGHDGLWK